MVGEWRELPFSKAVLVNPPVQLERGTRYPFVDMGAVSPRSCWAYPTQDREFSGGGSRFQHGDTLMARITPCLENGKIARFYAPEGSRVGHGSTEFIVIRGRPDITDTDFAYYLTRWEEVRSYAISQMAGTSGRQRVPTESLDHLPVPVPPLPEQRAIAHILGTLDDKIELNRRMSETLEQMARALFKAWFVDFEPVRAKMEGRWQRGNPLPPLPLGEGQGEGLPPKSHARLPSDLLAFARELRRNETDAERLLWRLLRNRSLAGAKFRRQHPFPPYVLDFYCHELKLAIELDGGQHNLPEGRLHDKVRTAKLAEHGIRVLRFWNHEVLRDPESVLEAIYQAIVERREELRPSPPAPLPAGEGSMAPGLPAHLYDLFPDRLVDSELGEIPEGWEQGTLADFSTLNPEVWTQETRPARINYVDLSNTKWGRIEAVISYEAAEAPSRAQRVLRTGDTIVGTVRPANGSYAFVSEPGLTGSTGFAVLRPRTACYAEFVYLAATAPDTIDTLAHLADGAAYPAVRPQAVAATPIVRPPDELLVRFSRAAGPILAKIAENERGSRTLAALRDTLLPRLISGELRVKDAERFLKERGL
jgi:very-short-patch-repair endonuclease/restriction endonuclease S subunit